MDRKKGVVIIIPIALVFIVSIFSMIGNKSKDLNILIDPGHGGNDPGTISPDGLYEKDINLSIAKKLYEDLKRQGYRVDMTRNEDLSLPVMERASMANYQNVDLFLSIHCNSSEEATGKEGLQVLYFPSNNSRELANLMSENILSTVGMDDMGIIERKDLIVLNQTNMPAVIIEAGFLNNEEESKKLSKGYYQRKISRGVSRGVKEYYKELRR